MSHSLAKLCRPHQRCPSRRIRLEEPPQSALADRPRLHRVHGFHALARHVCLPLPHENGEEAESDAISGHGVGAVGEEHLKRRYVVIN